MNKSLLRITVVGLILFAIGCDGPAKGDAVEAGPSYGPPIPMTRNSWFPRHQSSDGSWSPAELSSYCPSVDPCGGSGSAESQTVTTALVVMALSRTSGATINQLDFPTFNQAESLRRGIGWQLRIQQPNGYYGNVGSRLSNLGHVLTTLSIPDHLRRASKKGSRLVDSIQLALNAFSRPDVDWPWNTGHVLQSDDGLCTAWASMLIDNVEQISSNPFSPVELKVNPELFARIFESNQAVAARGLSYAAELTPGFVRDSANAPIFSAMLVASIPGIWRSKHPEFSSEFIVRFVELFNPDAFDSLLRTDPLLGLVVRRAVEHGDDTTRVEWYLANDEWMTSIMWHGCKKGSLEPSGGDGCHGGRMLTTACGVLLCYASESPWFMRN